VAGRSASHHAGEKSSLSKEDGSEGEDVLSELTPSHVHAVPGWN
jgi:hypothetical protein